MINQTINNLINIANNDLDVFNVFDIQNCVIISKIANDGHIINNHLTSASNALKLGLEDKC